MQFPKWCLFLIVGLALLCISVNVSCKTEPPVILKFSSSPAEISAGESATLSWIVKNATSVSINHDVGVVENVGNKKVSPPATITYTLSATNSGGTDTKSAVVKVSATLIPTQTAPTNKSDTISPIISQVQPNVTGQSACVISWITNEPATSQVMFGATISYGSTTPLDTKLVTSHSVTLTSLNAGLIYHFKVKSKDASGNEALGDDMTFTTTAVILSTPLKYRELDSFIVGGETDTGVAVDSGEKEKWVKNRAATYGYELPDKIVVGNYFALYVAIQNLDNVAGTFKVHYTLTTADKKAAVSQMNLLVRTPEEYAALDRMYYEDSIELYLEPNKARVAICPAAGILIAPDRVAFDHKHDIIPAMKTSTP